MSISVTAIAGLVAALTRTVHSGRSRLSRSRGIEPGAGFLLGKLVEHGDLRASDLTAHACVDAAVVSRQLKSLISNGLVQRIPDPLDGRAAVLQLTDAGRALHTSHSQLQTYFYESVFKDWSKQDRAEFEKLFERFVSDMTREIQNMTEAEEAQKHE